MPLPKKDDKKGGKKKKEEEIKIPKELVEQFTPDQFLLSNSIFTAYDKKAEGLLNATDIGLLVRLSGGNPSDAEVNEWIEAVKNQEGKMNLLGWLQVCAWELRTRKSDADIAVAFETFDHDKNGQVKAEEMRRQLIINAESFPENVADEFVTEATGNMDENGRINYRDFIAQMNADGEKAWKKKAKKLGIAGPDTGKGKKKGKKKKK